MFDVEFEQSGWTFKNPKNVFSCIHSDHVNAVMISHLSFNKYSTDLCKKTATVASVAPAVNTIFTHLNITLG